MPPCRAERKRFPSPRQEHAQGTAPRFLFCLILTASWVAVVTLVLDGWSFWTRSPLFLCRRALIGLLAVVPKVCWLSSCMMANQYTQ